MGKLFGLGVMIGRFQTLHAGHEMMINTAIELCDEVALFVGSAQESGTCKNPFTYELRRDMLERVFGDRVRVFPLNDIGVGNNSAWGDYVMENIRARFGKLPDLMVSGKESRRASWLDSEQGSTISELYIQKTIDISASEMREYYLNDDFETWKQFSNEALWPLYPQLKQAVIDSKGNSETASL